MSKDGEFFSLPNFKHVVMALLNNLLFGYCKSFLNNIRENTFAKTNKTSESFLSDCQEQTEQSKSL